MAENDFTYSNKKIHMPKNKKGEKSESSELITIEEYKGKTDFTKERNDNRTVIEDLLDFNSFFINNKVSNSHINRVSGLSTNSYSDTDNIFINKLSDMMTGVQNALGPEHYEIFSQYITGMKLADLIDEEGNILPLTDKSKLQEILTSKGITIPADEYLHDINKKLENCKIDLVKLSPDILDSTVTEVVSSDYGYDAIVLKNTAGNYLIVNSCTNAESTNDIYAIAYALAKQVVGDGELLELAIEQILPAINNSGINNSDYYLDLINNGGVEYLEEVYKGQLQANIDLINKYADKAEKEGNKLELNGYSLGGGIQLTAYSIACRDNPDLEKYIQSVSVFNPFISFVEQNPVNTGDEKKGFIETWKDLFSGKNNKDNCLIDYLANSNKVRIYSGEEDYISTFNNCVYDLRERFTFIKTEDLKRGQVQDITQIYSIILGDKANHGFKGIEFDAIDENGNIKEEGSYVSISDSMASAIGNDNHLYRLFQKTKEIFGFESEEDKYKVDYSSIIYQTINLAHLEDLFKDTPEAAPIIDELSDYLKDNVGDYTYDGIVDAIVDGAWDVVGDTIDSEVPKMVRGEDTWVPNFIEDKVEGWVGDAGTSLAHRYKDKDAFEDAFGGFLKSDENKEYVLSLLSNLKNGDYVKAYRNVKTLMSNLEEQFEMSYEDVGAESVNILGLEIDYTNYGEVFVNDIIKDELINILGQLEKQLDGYAMDVAKDYIEDSGGLGGVIEKILPFKE